MKEFHYRQFQPVHEIVSCRKEEKLRISVVIPARNEQETIGPIVSLIRGELIREAGLVDEIIVIDNESEDATRRRAEQEGARVFSTDEILPGRSCPRGKGTALWKSLFVASGDIIACVDADISNFSSRFVSGTVGPLVLDRSLKLVKSHYRRPLRLQAGEYENEGGRVTEILVRPFLNAFYPQLSLLRQPLSGEYAFRRSAVQSIRFSSGYGVEAGLLLDIFQRFGAESIAQVDMEVRRHRNRPLAQLGAMSFGILQALLAKTAQQKKITVNAGISRTHRIPGDECWRESEVLEVSLPTWNECGNETGKE